MIKNILIAIGFLVLIAILYGYLMYNKGPKNLNNISPDYTVSPAALLAEFDADENAAQTKYLNKIIQVQGELSDIQKVGEQTIWIISTGNPLSNIQCEMDGRFIKDVQDKVQKGSTVTVQGICSGKLMDIVINQAVCKL
jgi:hypothetical protein